MNTQAVMDGGNELTLQEKKDIEKGILDYVVSVCEKHGIPYFLAYGTLLGAVRHGGFIPWDDDIDIALLRPDYIRLLSAIDADGDARYGVMHSGCAGYYYPFAKVVDRRTAVEEANIEPVAGMGLWIDVFPLDGVKNPRAFRLKFLRLLDRCRAAAVNPRFPKKKYGCAFFLPWLFCRLVGWRFILSLEMRMSQKYGVEECEFLSCANQDRFVLPKSLFEESVALGFEGGRYRCPGRYREYLRLNYGDYMQLPPEDERQVHGMRAVMKTDGETER